MSETQKIVRGLELPNINLKALLAPLILAGLNNQGEVFFLSEITEPIGRDTKAQHFEALTHKAALAVLFCFHT